MRFAFDRLHGPYRRAWIFLFTLVSVEVIVSAIIAWRHFSIDPYQLYVNKIRWSILVAWLVVPFCWSGVICFKLLRSGSVRPIKHLLRLISYRSDWILRGLLLCALYIPAAQAYAVVKSSIPFFTTYFADDLFIKADIALLGQDAWSLSRKLFGYDFIFFIDRVYIIWFSYAVLLAGIFSFSTNAHLQIRATIALNLCWVILGGVFATLAASVGPCFYDLYYGSEYFSDLTKYLNDANSNDQILALKAMDFLVANRDEMRFGGGVSAMPSLHVSMAMLGFLASVSYSKGILLRMMAGVFLVLILIGSVHLGWHYFVDGIAAIVGTILIWWLAALVVGGSGAVGRGREKDHRRSESSSATR